MRHKLFVFVLGFYVTLALLLVLALVIAVGYAMYQESPSQFILASIAFVLAAVGGMVAVKLDSRF